MPLYDRPEILNWRKARRSMNDGNCVEVAAATGKVAIRDTKNLQGPVLRYSVASWRSFLIAVGRGDFDGFS